MSSVFLVTSNPQKLAEYRSYGLPFEVRKGVDIKEVVSDSLTVAIYKALAAGENALVEDSVLTINGVEVIDIRWRIQELVEEMQETRPDIQWLVTLAHHKGDVIEVFRGVLDCEIVSGIDFDNVPEDAFAFDPFLSPKELNTSLYDLGKRGEKDLHSPRYQAVQEFLNKSPMNVVTVSDIAEWKGEYQND